jgi:selenocysteine lyase/cysteine desulfurase
MTLKPNSIPVSARPSHFDVEPGIHNLENGYWSIMPRVVAQAFDRHNAYINRTNAIWARDVLAGGATRAAASLAAQTALARQMGCLPEEVAVTRNGSDALQMLIANSKAAQARRGGDLLRSRL